MLPPVAIQSAIADQYSALAQAVTNDDDRAAATVFADGFTDKSLYHGGEDAPAWLEQTQRRLGGLARPSFSVMVERIVQQAGFVVVHVRYTYSGTDSIAGHETTRQTVIRATDVWQHLHSSWQLVHETEETISSMP